MSRLRGPETRVLMPVNPEESAPLAAPNESEALVPGGGKKMIAMDEPQELVRQHRELVHQGETKPAPAEDAAVEPKVNGAFRGT
jgi:hypothetical protein